MQSIAKLFIMFCFLLSSSFGFAFEIVGNMLDNGIINYKVSNTSYESDIASQGEKSLVVWSGYPGWEVQNYIYGRFVDNNAQPIDSNIIHISVSAGSKWNPKIAYGKGKYCVIWEDQRNGDTRPDIYFTLVDTTGVVSDTMGRPVVIMPNEQFDADVGFCDSCFLAVWEDRRNYPYEGDIYGARIGLEGIVLDTDGFEICTQPSWQEWPVVTGNNYNFIVAWGDRRDGNFKIYYSLVTPGGDTLMGDGGRLSPSDKASLYPSVSSDGNDYFIAWIDSSQKKVVTRRVDIMGGIIDSVPVLVKEGNYFYAPRLTYCDSQYFVFYNSWSGGDDSVSLQRVNINNELLDINPIYIEKNATINVATANNRILCSYNDPMASNYSISAASIDTGGNVLIKRKRLTRDSLYVANSQWEPVAASNGSNYFVSWWGNSNNASGRDISTIQIDVAGNAVDTSLFICSYKWDQIWQVLSIGNDDCMEIWTQDSMGSYDSYRDIFGRLLDKNGYPKGSSFPISIADGNQHTADFGGLGYSGNSYLALWSDSRGGTVRCCEIKDGVVQDTAGKVVDVFCGNPKAEWNGDKYLAVYFVAFGMFYPWPIGGRLLNENGDTLGPRFIISDTLVDTWGISDVATGNKNWLAVWPDSAVYAARIDSNGNVLDRPAIQVSNSGIGCSWTRLAFDGENYIAVWYSHQTTMGYNSINGAIISPEGVILDRFTTKNNNRNQNYPCVASDGKGNVLVAWQEEAPEPYRNQRVYGAVFKTTQGIQEKPENANKNRFNIKLYPNPVRDKVHIYYQLDKQVLVEINVYNICGQKIKSLTGGLQQPGLYSIQWDCRNDNHQKISSGVYFYNIKIDNNNYMGKIVITR